eukprot:CAMPEP_0204342456 /NCGR_PEP_ID=MMETSP0469-20131031/24150_1 /ASSEMBLY_ACC=CAM_ASM_000384 /TAXON_ID=2969 /ORGANISM="Oxyrrhis marina" /LENGTH=154 /DNA_ID=CAMNT_0051327359 /DNA_START=433 /DNA_END=897 /DNA_ORIENTATION=-
MQTTSPGGGVEKKELELPAGRLAIVSKSAGDHDMCLTCGHGEWFHKAEKLKVTIAFDILGSESLADVAEGALSAGRLSTTGEAIRELLERVHAIHDENEYEKFEEADFRRMSESVNNRVMLFSVLQVLLMIGCSLYQMYSLVDFMMKSRTFNMV